MCECHLEGTCFARVHPLVGDGYCNDVTNIAVCGYDGGDCCRSCLIKKYCSHCSCLSGSIDNGYSDAVGNGFCDDEINTAACNYDGGDCCGSCINRRYCSECACHGDVIDDGIPNALESNGYCNDDTNIAACNYDGGDCCVNVNTDSCSDCNCLGGGVITSPGFPGHYDDNLDLTWLIQVQMGQKIEINFPSFDVEAHSSCG